MACRTFSFTLEILKNEVIRSMNLSAEIRRNLKMPCRVCFRIECIGQNQTELKKSAPKPMQMSTLTPTLTRLYMPRLHGITICGRRSCVCGLGKHKIHSNITTHDTSPTYVPYRHLNKTNTILTKTNPIQPTNLKREDEQITHHNSCTNVRSTTQLPSQTYRISLGICPRIYRNQKTRTTKNRRRNWIHM